MIDVKGLKKNYGGLQVLKGVDLTINKGDCVVLVGPSGCGKSTFLRCLNRLEEPDGGHVIFNGKEVTDHDIDHVRQKMGMVFQHFNLFPHLTVKKNITLAPVRLGLMKQPEADKKAMELLERIGLADKADTYPNMLSGGQKQRIAIVRALAMNPDVLLFDEPLSNLDARLRLQTREEIRRIQQNTGITTIFVTHDQEEAMSISDKIVVMKLGVKQQEGVPQEVYNNPCNKFVANFLGTPPINLFKGRIQDHKVYIGDDMVREITAQELEEAKKLGRDLSDQEVTVGIRPEGIIIDEKANNNFHFKVERILTMGRDIMLNCDQEYRLSDTKFIIDAFTKVQVGDVACEVKPHKCFAFSLEEGEPRLI